LPANTIAWSYYVGVDQVGVDCYDRAARELSRSGDPMTNSNTGYNPLAALALGKNCYLSHGTLGEDIDYVITDNLNANAYLRGQPYNYFKKGKVLNDYAMMSSPKAGNLTVCLRNDNAVTGVTVLIKVTAISISSTTEPYLKD
jgi:hypothetical protein